MDESVKVSLMELARLQKFVFSEIVILEFPEAVQVAGTMEGVPLPILFTILILEFVPYLLGVVAES